jgi:hypothetical protein
MRAASAAKVVDVRLGERRGNHRPGHAAADDGDAGVAVTAKRGVAPVVESVVRVQPHRLAMTEGWLAHR